jgi:hypothetical protein
MASIVTDKTVKPVQPKKAIYDKDLYLNKLNDGDNVIYLVAPIHKFNLKENRLATIEEINEAVKNNDTSNIVGGIIKYSQGWIKGIDFQDEDGNDVKGFNFPVQTFAGEPEIGIDGDPFVAFQKQFPEYVDEQKPYDQFRMFVAVEQGGEFKLKIFNPKGKVVDLLVELPKINPNYGIAAIPSDMSVVGQKLIIKQIPTGKVYKGYAEKKYEVEKVKQDKKPDLSALVEKMKEISIYDTLGGKTPKEVVDILHKRGFKSFEFEVKE